LGFAHSVPFYLYVPQEILESTSYHYDNLRVGSHRDIFPTLYAFSLSNSEYTSLGGRNLLEQKDIDQAVGFNESVMITEEGVVNISTPELLYPWRDNDSLQVLDKPVANALIDLPEDYVQLQTLFINSQVKGFIQ